MSYGSDVQTEQGDEVFVMDIFTLILLIDISTLATESIAT